MEKFRVLCNVATCEPLQLIQLDGPRHDACSDDSALRSIIHKVAVTRDPATPTPAPAPTPAAADVCHAGLAHCNVLVVPCLVAVW
jgi:hypothetical protein